MSKNKTQANDNSVKEFLDKVENEQKRADSYKILEMLKKITGFPPKMWGKSIIGFGKYHYKYTSGREGDFMKIGFSPRKKNISLYLMDGMTENIKKREEFKNLGKFTTGKSCLYINNLSQIDEAILYQILKQSFENFNQYIQEKDGWYSLDEP